MTARLARWVLGAALCCTVQGQEQRYDFVQSHMGTRFRLALYAPDSIQAWQAAHDAFRRVEELDISLSDYRAESELSGVSDSAGSGQAVAVSGDLHAVLTHSQAVAELTDGAFDVTIGSLTRLWRWSSRRNIAPDTAAVALARRSVGFRHLILTSDSVRLPIEGMRLDLGGIAKGYAADAGLRILQSRGVDRALVDAGGDIAIGAPPPDSCGWSVALPNGKQLWLRHQAIAVSGPMYKAISTGGLQYSHLLAPPTGHAMTDLRTVVVMARRGVDADAFATAFSVMEPDEALRVAEDHKGLSFQISLTMDGIRQLHMLRAPLRTETFQSNILDCNTRPLYP